MAKGSDMEKYRHLLLNLKILHVFGLWPSYDSDWSAGAYLAFAFLASSLVCAFFVSVWAATFVSDGDLGELTDVLSVGLTNLSNGFKLAPFWFARRKLVRMVRVLHEDLYAAGSRRWSPEKEAIVRGSARSVAVLTAVYVTWYVFTCGSWLLTSLVISAESAGNATDARLRRTLPYPGWFPYDEKRSPAYEWSYLFQAFGAMLDTIDAAIMDCFYIAVVIHTYTQFKLLAVSLRAIEVDAVAELAGAAEVHSRMNERLNDCIRYHQMIYRYLDRRPASPEGHRPCPQSRFFCVHSFVDEVQSLLGPITMVECIVMSFILCTISYQATIVSKPSLPSPQKHRYEGC